MNEDIQANSNINVFICLLGPEHRMVRGPIEIVPIIIIIIFFPSKEGAFWGL